VIEIVIHKTGTPGRLASVVKGEVVVKSTRQPFYDGARALLDRGFDPDTVICARWHGSPITAMQTTVGEAAKWSVSDSDSRGLRRQRWMPYEDAHSRGAVEASAADDEPSGR
jgi:hypothetical protein